MSRFESFIELAVRYALIKNMDVESYLNGLIDPLENCENIERVVEILVGYHKEWLAKI